MPLEATVIVIDNSRYAINGDYAPDRFHAQREAIQKLYKIKTDAHGESMVGLMSAAVKPNVLTAVTRDQLRFDSALHKTGLEEGDLDVQSAISAAQLALKYRPNKAQRQRIVLFVGSPALRSTTSDDLVKLGKRLKKDNVAVDVVLFGEPALAEPPELEDKEQADKLRKLVETVSANDNSHILVIEPSTQIIMAEVIRNSEIVGEDLNLGGGFGEAEGGGEYDMDANMDPELAAALRLSLQEEQQRQDALANNNNPSTSTGTTSGASAAVAPANSASTAAPHSSVTSAPSTTAHPTSASTTTTSGPSEADAHRATASSATGIEADDDDEDLRLALEMSQAADTSAVPGAVGAGARDAPKPRDEDVEMGDGGDGLDEDMDPELRLALQMSLEEAKREPEKK